MVCTHSAARASPSAQSRIRANTQLIANRSSDSEKIRETCVEIVNVLCLPAYKLYEILIWTDDYIQTHTVCLIPKIEENTSITRRRLSTCLDRTRSNALDERTRAQEQTSWRDLQATSFLARGAVEMQRDNSEFFNDRQMTE